MKLLCLETSSAACSAAVVVEDVNYDRYELAERRHVGALLPMAEILMNKPYGGKFLAMFTEWRKTRELPVVEHFFAQLERTKQA